MSDNNEKYQDTFNEESYEFELGQYIYLLQEREFRKTKEKIYKLGKTKQQHTKRFAQYPKDSILLNQIVCDDCDKIERILINLFNEKFKKRKDIGNEYFEGDYKYMIDLIYNTIKQEETKLEPVFKIQEWWRDIIYKNIKNENQELKKQIEKIEIYWKEECNLYQSVLEEAENRGLIFYRDHEYVFATAANEHYVTLYGENQGLKKQIEKIKKCFIA